MFRYIEIAALCGIFSVDIFHPWVAQYQVLRLAWYDECEHFGLFQTVNIQAEVRSVGDSALILGYSVKSSGGDRYTREIEVGRQFVTHSGVTIASIVDQGFNELDSIKSSVDIE
jgi:hypothetical protein